VQWDSDVLGSSVGELYKFEVLDGKLSQRGFDKFKIWIYDNNYSMISCRLPHDKLLESCLLEKNGFRFIETVLHPTINDLQKLTIAEHESELAVSSVLENEVPLIADIAASVFKYERFHVDPFLSSNLGDIRYKQWIENCFLYEKQELLKVTLNGSIVAFFLVESNEGQVYWHLTAVASEWQGKGLGMRVWKAIIEHHKNIGEESIHTTISARNIPVLNLYSKLHFYFLPPEMTFHWTKYGPFYN